MQNVVEAIDSISRTTHEKTSKGHKKKWGQFFTPPSVAEFMGELPAQPVRDRHLRILDPGAGTGILGISAGLRALQQGAKSVTIVAVEAEDGALGGLRHASETASQSPYGERLRIQVVVGDFLELGSSDALGQPFDLAVSNPPYFKMSPSRPLGGDAPNAYARFMEVAAQQLKPDGELVFIVPRSFASGYYFRRFRERFHRTMSLRRIHVFESRSKAFRKTRCSRRM